MELSKEIILDLIKERTASSKECGSVDPFLAIREAETFLSGGLSIAVHILLGHTCCQAKEPSRCAAIRQIEVWTIKILGEGMPLTDEDKMGMQMPPMFLRQAIRSQLYFSPIKSWFSTAEQKKPGFCCLYKISTSSHFEADDSLLEEHCFPLCRLENRSHLKVHVKWLKKDGFPNDLPECPSRRIDDERWVLPSIPCPKNQLECLSERCSLIQRKKKSLSRHTSRDFIDSKESKDETKCESARSPRRKLTPAAKKPNTLKEPVDSTRDHDEKKKPSYATKEILPSGFHPSTRLPLHSSPAPIKRTVQRVSHPAESLPSSSSSGSDSDLALSFEKENDVSQEKPFVFGRRRRVPSGRLLCNFEESALNGRLEPASTVQGFKLKIAISGTFSQLTVPVTTSYFKSLSDDNETPSLYLSQCDLTKVNKRTLHIPKECTVQAVLFNPQGSVVKIFLVKVDVSDMPARSKTFLRQRTVSIQEEATGTSTVKTINNETGTINGRNGLQKSVLKFVIHLRLKSDSRQRVYLHSDIKMLLSNKGNDLEGLELVSTKLDSWTEMPKEPKYSPVK